MKAENRYLPYLIGLFRYKCAFSKENDTFVISNSSLVVKGFEKSNANVGALGVLGPMRLDYKKVIPYIDYFTDKVTDILTKIDDNDAQMKESED